MGRKVITWIRYALTVHSIDESEDGLLFCSDRYIGKRSHEGRLLWMSEPKCDYPCQPSFGMAAANDTCMVVGW